MRKQTSAFVTVMLLMLTGTGFARQDSPVARQEIAFKRGMSGYPKAALMPARRMTQEGNIVHLTDSLEFRIFTTEKERLLIRGEEADFNTRTGEATAHGNSSSIIEATR